MGRKQDILEAARDLFLERGIEGMTMRAVAGKVGISAPAIYRHYENKDDLLRAVVDLGRERFTLYLTRGLEGSSPAERLRRAGESYLDFALDHPHDYKVMFLSWDRLRIGLHGPDRGYEHSPTFRFLLDRVAECLPAERAASPEAVMGLAMLVWAQVHGLASLYVAGGGAEMMPLEEFRAMAFGQVDALLRILSDQFTA